MVNDSPALHVSSRYDYYYTLEVGEGGVLIDCAYFDVRNIYNGARASAGMCGLNIGLSETYSEIAQNYSNKLRESIFSFDTLSQIEDGRAKSFLIGKIGSVEVYDRYSSSAALKNSAPQKYIKSDSGCFGFDSSVGFLVFFNKGALELKYLDILRSEDPMTLQRFSEEDLKAIALDECT